MLGPNGDPVLANLTYPDHTEIRTLRVIAFLVTRKEFNRRESHTIGWRQCEGRADILKVTVCVNVVFMGRVSGSFSDWKSLGGTCSVAKAIALNGWRMQGYGQNWAEMKPMSHPKLSSIDRRNIEMTFAART